MVRTVSHCHPYIPGRPERQSVTFTTYRACVAERVGLGLGAWCDNINCAAGINHGNVAIHYNDPRLSTIRSSLSDILYFLAFQGKYKLMFKIQKHLHNFGGLYEE